MSDDKRPNLTVLPTAVDEMRAAVENLARLAPLIAEAAPGIAKARKAMFDAHIAAGFSEAQAMALATRFV